MPRRTNLLMLATASALALFGCTQTPFASPRTDNALPAMQKSVIGKSVEGRPIEMTQFGTSGETVLLIGAIHGNEQASGRLMLAAIAHLTRKPESAAGCRVLIVPIANPDGYEKGTRYNARRVDLNRNFSDPARPSSSASTEPESIALRDLIPEARPARIISVHQPLSCVDYDGPGSSALAEEMSYAGRLPVRKLGGKPGSLGTYAGGILSIPVITVELPRDADQLNNGQLWDRYGEMILTGIRGVD